MGSASHHQTVNEAGSERVSATDTVVDLKILARHGLVKLAVRVTDRAPIIDGRGLGVSQGRRHELEVGKLAYGALDHAPEASYIQLGVMLVQALHLETERRSEVLLVADHHVHERGQRAVDFLGPRLTANRLPERVSVIEIIRDERTVSFGRLHRLARDLGRRLRERAEYAARVKPTRALLAKDTLPINIARLELRDSRVASVRTPERRTHAVTPLCEVQAIAHRATDAVVLYPLDV